MHAMGGSTSLRPRAGFGAVAIVLLLLAAACSGGDDDDGSRGPIERTTTTGSTDAGGGGADDEAAIEAAEDFIESESGLSDAIQDSLEQAGVPVTVHLAKDMPHNPAVFAAYHPAGAAALAELARFARGTRG